MSNIKDVAGSAAICSHTRFFSIYAKIQFVALIVAAAMMLYPSGAIAQDDEYVKIYATIQEADSLVANHHPESALKKYGQAATALKEFQKNYPAWNKSVVAYRQNYVTQKIAALTSTGGTPVETLTGNAAASASAAKPVSKGPVKLLDAGAEPRVALRLHPKAGDKQTTTMTLKVAADIKMGQMQNQSIKVPPITVTMDTTIKDVAANGDITFEMVMGGATVTGDEGTPPEMSQAIKAALGSFNGITVAGVVSDRGASKKSDVSMPAATDPQINQFVGQMKDSFSRMTVQLPEEPVGPGAKWEVKMPEKTQGMTVDQTANYQVVSIDGDRVATKMTITQRAANQKMQSAATGGAAVDMTRLTGQGSGTSTIDLSQLVPKEADLGIQTEMTMGMNAGGQKQTMSMKMDMNVHFEAK